jgi:NNP family nitrate/nitrite transporter-like MFS transporter
VLTGVCAVWMHWTVMDMLHREAPQLAGRIEHPSGLPPLLGRRHRRTHPEPTTDTDPAEPEEARA